MTVENSTTEHEFGVNTSHLVETKTDFRYTLGNYADKWSSKSEYDPETGWKLTEGNMEGSGSIVTSIVDVTDSVKNTSDYYDHRASNGGSYDYLTFSFVTANNHRSERVNRTDTISMKQTVENGAWVTTEQTRTINETGFAEENHSVNDFYYDSVNGCHLLKTSVVVGDIDYHHENKTETKRVDGQNVTTRDVYQSHTSNYHGDWTEDDVHDPQVNIDHHTTCTTNKNRTTINDNGTLTDEGSFESRYWREYYGGNQEGEWVEGTLSGHKGRTLFYGEVEEYEYEGYPYSHDYFHTITPPQTSGSPTSFEIRDGKAVALGPAVEAEKVAVPLPQVPAGSGDSPTDLPLPVNGTLPQDLAETLRDRANGFVAQAKNIAKFYSLDRPNKTPENRGNRNVYFFSNKLVLQDL